MNRIAAIGLALVLLSGCNAQESHGDPSRADDDHPISVDVSDSDAVFEGHRASFEISEFQARDPLAEEVRFRVRSTVDEELQTDVVYGFRTGLGFSREVMRRLMEREVIPLDQQEHVVGYPLADGTIIHRSFRALELDLHEQERMTHIRIHLGEVVSLDGSAVPDSSPQTAYADIYGQIEVGCTVVGPEPERRHIHDANWETEYCRTALEETGLQPLVDIAP